MEITFVAGNYPTLSRPTAGIFVQQFVWAMARQGHECSVINPVSVFDRRYGPYSPSHSTEDAGDGHFVSVYQPRYISFSSKNLGWTHTGRWTNASFTRVVLRTMKELRDRPNIIYGHFLYPAGHAAVCAASKIGMPSVAGVGESSAWTLEAFGAEMAKRHFEKQGYFLANSTPNKEMLVNLLGISSSRILVEPNGVDLSRMYPRKCQEMKKKHGMDTHEFLVAFVGSNDARKGPERVLEAIEGLSGVCCILLGRGTDSVRSVRILKSGPVAHEIIPELLSCADLFVLPTTNEGSCNAVIEAMACGLPIVTAHGTHMNDIVDDEVAVRVDPLDVRAIRAAILALKDDPGRRKRMSEACLRKAKQFDINNRARRVTAWMVELARKHRA